VNIELLSFHYNTGYMNVPQCYVISVLPVLCVFLSTKHNYRFRNFWVSVVTIAHFGQNGVMFCRNLEF